MSEKPTFIQKDYIDLPSELIRNKNGLSLDIGGSTMKIVYRPKDGMQTKSNEPPVAEGYERLRLALFSRNDIDEGLDFIQNNCAIRQNEETEICEVYTTGLGGNQYANKIAEKIKLKLVNLSEVDCFVKTFDYIVKTFPESQVLDPPNKDGQKEGQQYVDTLMGFMQKAEEHDFKTGFHFEKQTVKDFVGDNTLPLSKQIADMYPCIFMMMGSGIGIFKIEANGKCEFMETFSGRGGRNFMGFGSLLTGGKSYEELIRLAEKGTGSAVSEHTTDLTETAEKARTVIDENEKPSVYGLDMNDMLVYLFGKSCFKTVDDFKAEDLSRTNVIQYAMDVSQKAHLAALTEGAKHVFYCGNGINSEVMRRELTKANIMRTVMPIGNGNPVQFHFLSHGGHYGALGAFLHTPNNKSN